MPENRARPNRAAGVSHRVCVQVCVLCGDTGQDADGRGAGRELYSRLVEALPAEGAVAVEAAECLAVCHRPVTIAFRAPGKWSYIVGDADPAADADDIVKAALAVAASPHGIPAMADRPAFFRRGVIGRLPPVADA